MRILIIASLIFIPCLIISCKKSAGPPSHQNTFSASVNGQEFVSKTIKVAISGSSLPGTKAVHIYATNQSGYEVLLYMYEYDGIKSIFNLGQPGSSLGAFCTKDCDYLTMISSPSNSGEIKIVSFDKISQSNGEIITGTFQFEADGSAGKFSLTNGHFSVLVPN